MEGGFMNVCSVCSAEFLMKCKIKTILILELVNLRSLSGVLI